MSHTVRVKRAHSPPPPSESSERRVVIRKGRGGAEVDDSEMVVPSSVDLSHMLDRTKWTECPNKRLVTSVHELEELVVKAVAYCENVSKFGSEPDGGALMRALGAFVTGLTGLDDPCFSAELPPPGTEAFVLQMLCARYDKTLGDGDDTLTGAIVAAFVRALEKPVVFRNTAMVCHRKGDAHGNELKHGQDGCKDPTGVVLYGLSLVKQLHTLGLLSAGVIVLGIFASSNASVASFGLDHKKVPHFTAQTVGGVYKGIPIFCAPHFKYGSATCINNKSAGQRLGADISDRLSAPSRFVNGIAGMGARALGFEDAAAVGVAKDIYERMRTCPISRVTVREWRNRFTSTSTPETEARIKEELRKNSSKGGAFLHAQRAVARAHAHSSRRRRH